MKKLSKNTEHSMIVRIITGLVLGLVLGPVGIFGGWYLLAVSFVLVFFAAYEILALPGKSIIVSSYGFGLMFGCMQ